MNKIVCIGDSLTYGLKIRRSEVWTKIYEDKSGLEVINKGINGDSTSGMLARFYRDVVDNNPTHVIIMGGSNDLIMEVPLSIVNSNIATMVHLALGNNIIPIIGIQILTIPDIAKKCWSAITDFTRVNKEIMEYREWVYKFSTIFKVQTIDFNAELKKHIQENISDYYIDGLHLTAEGNKVLANIINI